jgi:hypothetical protein
MAVWAFEYRAWRVVSGDDAFGAPGSETEMAVPAAKFLTTAAKLQRASVCCIAGMLLHLRSRDGHHTALQ